MYNLRYKDSFEQDKYAASLRREQSIFEELIRAKGHMVLPDLQQVSISWCHARLACGPNDGLLTGFRHVPLTLSLTGCIHAAARHGDITEDQSDMIP